MASTYGTRIRFVKCPKCHKVLLEVSDVPVYKCGECDTVLKAKYYKAVEENAISESVESNIKNLAPSNEPISGTETISLPPSIANKIEQEHMLSSIVQSQEEDAHESSNTSENSIEDGAVNSAMQSRAANSRQHSDDEPEESLKADLDIDMRNDSNSITKHDVEGLDGNDSRAAISRQHSDDEPEESLKADLNVDKRNDSNAITKHDVEGPDGNDMQKCAPVITRSMSENRRGNSSRQWNLAGDHTTSLGSAAFHSVNSWMESERKIQSGPLPMESPLVGGSTWYQNKNIALPELRNLEYEQTKVLTLVDELKHQLNGLFKKSERGWRKRTVTSTKLESNPPSRFPHKQNLSSIESLHSNSVDHLSQHCACRDCCHSLHLLNHECRYQNATKQYQDKEIRQPAKRHCLPALGGAPFIVCNKCLTLLQLPTGFPVSAKAMHMLRCGACSALLRYSFRTTPYGTLETPLGAPHPPSEVSSSDFSDHRAYVGPVSFNDVGPDIERSYSMETKARHLDVLGGSSESEQDRRRKMEYRSSLHLLMGYPSAREVMRKHIDD